MSPVSGFAPTSSPPSRSDNAVQKISELRAMSNARRNINRMACRFMISPLAMMVGHGGVGGARRFAGATFPRRCPSRGFFWKTEETERVTAQPLLENF
jgi:hypothetical protein